MTESEQAIPIISDLRHEWCPHCLKSTLQTATITAITAEGIHTIGGYAVCEECAWSPYGDKAAP